MLPCFRVYALLLALVIPSQVFAIEWFKAYMKGQEEIKKGNCAEGKAHILAAMRENPRADLHASTYGTQRMEYIPQYYLAICAFQSGNLAEAQRYAKDAELARIGSSSKAKEFAAFKAKLESSIAAQKPPVSAPEQKPPEKKPVPEAKPPQVAEPITTPQPKPAQPSPEVQNRNLAIASLRDAKEAFEKGQYDEARNAANRALQLDPNLQEARRIVSESSRLQAKQIQDTEKQKRLAEVQNALRSGDLATAENLALAVQVEYPSDSEAASLLREIRKRGEAKVQQEQRLQLTKNLEKHAVVAYYRGQYETTIQLARDGLAKAPDSWLLNFFMGCSYAALSFLEDENKEGRLNLARESFRKARSGNDKMQIPPYISPKIVEIYKTS